MPEQIRFTVHSLVFWRLVRADKYTFQPRQGTRDIDVVVTSTTGDLNTRRVRAEIYWQSFSIVHVLCVLIVQSRVECDDVSLLLDVFNKKIL